MPSSQGPLKGSLPPNLWPGFYQAYLVMDIPPPLKKPPPSADSTPSQKALLYTKLNPTHLLRPRLGSTRGVCLGLSLRLRGCPPLPGYLQISKEDQELPWVPTSPSHQISVNQSSCPGSELCTICSHLSHCPFLHKVSSPLTS